MKTSMIAVGSFATVVMAQNWPSNFPECGRNCVTNMMGQAAALGCPDSSDAGCLCNNVNFLYGMRDCSQQSCANNPGDAAQVVNFGANYCAQQGVVVTYPSIPATISAGAPSATATVVATTPNPIGAGGSAASSVLGSATSAASGAVSSASGALSSASGALSSALGSASSAVGSATSAAGSQVSAIVSTVTSGGSTFPTTIGSTTIVGGAAGAVSSFVSTVTDGGSSFVTTIVSTASGSGDVTETSAVSTGPVVSTISSGGSAVGTTTVGSTTVQQTTTRAATDSATDSAAPTSSSAGNFAAQKTAAPVGILAAAGLAALFI